MEISSEKNDLFKTWQSLLTSKGIKKENLFILSGEKLIREFLRNPNFSIQAEIIHNELSPLLPASQKKTFILTKKLYDALDGLGTHFNLLILKFQDFETWNPQSKPHNLEVICPVGDPQNLGSLVRAATAFNVHSVILTKESTHPFHPKSVKASAGAILTTKFKCGPSLDSLKNNKEIYCLDLNGKRINEFQWPKDLYLTLGEEGPGLPKQHQFNKLSIPIENVESLNVSVSAGIAFYDYKIKRGL